MPQNAHYAPVVALISPSRLGSYRTTFKPASESELYGIYIWSQHAAGALYPLLQNLEISLRNAIDKEARKRFGEFWWKSIGNTLSGDTRFHENMVKAERNLEKEWRKKASRNRHSGTQPLPIWTHDQIVAATDFSTWHFILNNEFAAPTPAHNATYLWPKSLSKVFKNYSAIAPNQQKIRKALSDLCFELREYRNRVFHHEPIWIKAPNVNDARTAIDTIRIKITKIENIITALDTGLLNIMSKVGLFDNARRTCSVEELDIYRYTRPYCPLTQEQKTLMETHCATANDHNETLIWESRNQVFGLRKIR
ncbi:Abi family protein [Ewingella americana]